MKQPNLYLMIGIPGSGKSTYIQKNKKDNEIWVSRDMIRFSLLSDKDAYFSNEKAVFREFRNQIQDGLDCGLNVYADATHLNEQSRNKILDALNLNDVNVIPIYFNIDIDTCIQRNNLRTGRANVPEQVIRNMRSALTPPSMSEKHQYSKIIEVND